MKTKLLFAFCCLLAFAGRAQNWGHVGPYSTNFDNGNMFESGRVDCFMLDPGFDGNLNQTMYLGSMSGGLWVTYDMGQQWNNIVIPGAIPFHGISALEYSAMGYAFVGTCNSMGNSQSGGSIYKFDPAANSWTATNFSAAAPPGTLIKDIAIFPNNPAIVFAATDQGLYRSVDLGTNWTNVLTGDIEKVAFIEQSAAQGGFQVFASGYNILHYSNDKGQIFDPHLALIIAIQNAVPANPNFYADMAPTYNAANPNILYLYVDGLHSNPAPAQSGTHTLVRLEIDKINLNENISPVNNYYEAGGVPGRMCVAAHDQVAYFGGVAVKKWAFNFSMNYPNIGIFSVPYDQGTDDSSGANEIGYVFHDDVHDLIILPQLQYLFVATDGGFFRDAYTLTNTPTPNGTIYFNNWTRWNYGLNISQIWGLGISDQDPSKFFTGEQDTKAFMNLTNSTTYDFFGVEPSNVIIDKFNSNNYLFRNDVNMGIFNGTTIGGNNADPKHYYDNTNASFCSTNSFLTYPEPGWGINTFFQDPNRPGYIYHGASGPALTELCTSSLKEILKATFPAKYDQYVNGMTFSKADKNKIHVSISNRLPPDEGKPRVFMYNGTNFDDSWYGHNVTWQERTPANTDPVFTVPLTTSNEYLMESVGIAASDWDAERIWWAVRNVPGNYHLKVLKRNGGVWSDYSQGIPYSEVPVSIVYEQGSNDQLYLGTNVNVYYRNATMSSWQLYSGTLPNVCMQQLRINYGDNTLNAGTYGRGVWKSDLACPPDVSIAENGNTVADKFVEASSYIIGSGIISWGDVKYRAGEYIDLQPGFLVSAGSTTRFYAFIHGCANEGNTFREAQNEDDYDALEMMTKSELKGEHEPQARVMPNPGSGIFYLERGSADEARIMVYDLNGRCVFDKQHVNTQREAIDLSENSNGLYLVRVITGGQVENFRIVKQ
ncbi:MAG: glycosyl hydrolase [Bacteroidetes bacterium]|nr:MAG: glycosyl hydrolase [Bacteroidota bacterium]